MEEKIIQITAGRGPAECCWVVAQILKFLLEEAAEWHLSCQVLSREKGPENGTLYSALVILSGEHTEGFINRWKGTIQWIGKSKFRKFHKRKNWFVGIDEIQLSSDFNVNESDIQYQAIRSGGPGGQHVNKVSTAIRATHLPTGITVLASDNRSQGQNKKNARTRLLSLLKAKNLEKTEQQVRDNWQQHNELQRGNPTRVFRGTDFKKNHIEKSYKRKRQEGKNELRNYKT